MLFSLIKSFDWNLMWLSRIRLFEMVLRLPHPHNLLKDINHFFHTDPAALIHVCIQKKRLSQASNAR